MNEKCSVIEGLIFLSGDEGCTLEQLRESTNMMDKDILDLIDEIVDEEISVGDYVLTGGELPALILADSVSRMLPGVLADTVSFTDESHYNSLLEYPQYTRPYEWHGRAVPDILLSGHHANIEKYRRQQSLERTYLRRPDMLSKAQLDKKDIEFLRALKAKNKKEQKEESTAEKT